MLTAGKQVKTSAFESNKIIFKKLEKINSCFLKKKRLKTLFLFKKTLSLENYNNLKKRKKFM